MFLTNLQLQTQVVQLQHKVMDLNIKLNTKNKHVKEIYYLQQAVKELKKERKVLLGRIKSYQTPVTKE